MCGRCFRWNRRFWYFPVTIKLMIEVNLDLAVQHGLTPDEYKKIKILIGRNPNFTELEFFSNVE